MTAAHEALIRELRRTMLEVPDLSLRAGVPNPGERGDVHFPTRQITIDVEASDGEFVSTLMHELVHLRRGPAWEDEAAREEGFVREETARLLVPGDALPAILEAARPERIAAALGVDEPTARFRIALAREDQTQHNQGEVTA